MRLRCGALVVLLTLFSIAPGLTLESVANEKPNRISILTTTVQLSKVGQDFVGEAVFALEGDAAVSIEVDLVDVWTNETGSPVILPLGSTPLTGKDRVKFGLFPKKYEPTGEVQKITIPLSISASQLSGSGLITGVRLTARSLATSQDGNGVEIVASAVSYVIAITDQSQLDGFDTSFAVDSFIVRPIGSSEQESELSSMFFVESGPAELVFQGSNSGEMFVLVSHSISLRSRDLFFQTPASKAQLLEKIIPEQVVIPGQFQTEAVPLTGSIPESGLIVDLVSEWGLYEATILTTTKSGSGLSTEAARTITFLVFPIRTAFGIVLALASLFLLMFRLGAGRRNARKSASETKDPVQASLRRPALSSYYFPSKNESQPLKIPKDLSGLWK